MTGRGVKRCLAGVVAVALLVVLAASQAYDLVVYDEVVYRPAAGLSVRASADEVAVNGITLPIASGWTMRRGDGADYCAQPDRTVLVGEHLTHGWCPFHEAIEVDWFDVETFVPQYPTGSTTVREMTLPGGQP